MAAEGLEKVERNGRAPAPRILLPRVKFTGQQPGEEGVEKDEDDFVDESGVEDGEVGDDDVDERGLPKGEPSTEGKFST